MQRLVLLLVDFEENFRGHGHVPRSGTVCVSFYSHVDDAVLRQLFSEITQWVYDQSGIELPENERVFEVYINPRAKKSAQGKLGYRGPMQRQARERVST